MINPATFSVTAGAADIAGMCEQFTPFLYFALVMFPIVWYTCYGTFTINEQETACPLLSPNHGSIWHRAPGTEENEHRCDLNAATGVISAHTEITACFN